MLSYKSSISRLFALITSTLLLLVLSTLVKPTIVSAQQKECPPGEVPFRPGGECASTTDYIHTNYNVYKLTCQDTPTVKLRRTTNVPTAPGILPVTVTVDLGSSELGGLGPSADAYSSYGSDYLAQYYPFSGLFDKPLYQEKTPREASRTFWRFLSSFDQANAKATFLNQVRTNTPPINNDSIVFYSPDPPRGTVPSPTPTPQGNDTTYGFNWGYGHLNPKACEDANGRAVTILMPLGAGSDPNHSMLREYHDCYAGASMRIVRITEFNGSTPTSEFTSAGAGFKAIFGSDYIVLGNELNNLDAEYPGCGDLVSCGHTYVDQFNAFKASFGSGNLSAAPLDTSNTVYDAAIFLGAAKIAYATATFTAANSYKGAGGCGIRCSETSYLWLQSQIGTSRDVILTEYGLAPGTDNKLTDVLNFYKNNYPTGVKAVTPLVRNPCSSAVGQWLRMVNWRFFDVENSEVNPTSCATNGKTLYPDSMTYLELDQSLTGCLKSVPVCKNYLDDYANLDPRTKSAYDALFPLNFDNIRGYQVLNNIIAKENIPYVQAIYQGLTDEQYGLLNGLSPQWINDQRDHSLRNNGLKPLARVPEALESNFKEVIRVVASTLDTGTCNSHTGVYLPAPLTYPDKSLSQTVLVPYVVTEHEYTYTYPSGVQEIRTRYQLTGNAQGNPVAVLNNPLMESLDQVVYKGKESLVNMLLPAFVNKTTDEKDMVAPIAYLSSPEDGVRSTTETLGLNRSVIARLSGQVHTTLCTLRNKWLIPQSFKDKTLNCDKMLYDQMIAEYRVEDEEDGTGGNGRVGVPCRVIKPSEAGSCAYPTQYPPADQFYIYDNVKSCKPEDRAKLGTSENKTYTVCCPSTESLHNVYALRAAVCGNVAEINPGCGVHNGSLFCWGNNYRADRNNEGTDSRFPLPAEGSRKSTGDFATSECFRYNYVQYCPNQLGSGNVVWCDSNVTYCGG